MFENILKEMALIAFKSNLTKTEKVQAFLRHLNVNLASQYNIPSLTLEVSASEIRKSS